MVLVVMLVVVLEVTEPAVGEVAEPAVGEVAEPAVVAVPTVVETVGEIPAECNKSRVVGKTDHLVSPWT